MEKSEFITSNFSSSDSSPIGVFDSGIGGLSVLKEIKKLLPHENCVYFADRAKMPYGEKSPDEIADRCREIARFFMAQKAKIIVIACNTASAAALYSLRREFPAQLFVGMEPAIKPAAAQSQAQKIGVLATAGTFRGRPYAGVVERFARDAKIYEQVCPQLASLIETGAPEKELRDALTGWIAPLRAAGIDQLVLACTHYPLILPLIQEVAGHAISVIDPSPAIARRVAELLAENHLQNQSSEVGETSYYAGAECEAIAVAVKKFIGESSEVHL